MPAARLRSELDSKDALDLYHGRMAEANQSRIEKRGGFDYNATATRNKEDLKPALQQAAQERAPAKPAY